MPPNGPPGLTSNVARTIKTANELLAAGRIDDADQLSRSLLAVTASVPVQLLACAVAEARPDLPQALALVTAALLHHGENAELLVKQAQVLMQLRRRREGVEAARRAAEICPQDARLLQAIAKIHVERNEPAEGKPLLQRAIELSPNDPAIVYDLAVAHFYLNEMDEASALLQRVLAVAPGYGVAHYVHSQLRTQTPESNSVAILRRALLRPKVRKQDAIPTYFALAKELEDIGEYQESFAVLAEGNRIKRSTLDYDVRNDLDAMQNVMNGYTSEALARIDDGDQAVGPIFIVGMPRTGATLVERILGSHDAVKSLGGLMDFPAALSQMAERAYLQMNSTDTDFVKASLHMDFGDLGRGYLGAVQQIANGRNFVVDTLPFNFRYCGLIHKALPNAKIVHLTRDPLDTCYAVFKRLFVNAYHYSYRLNELAQFFVAYRRTMAHWHAVMPGVIYDLSYEALVADPPAQCRMLLDFCGLPWQDEVLDYHQSRAASTTASAAQVCNPIYQTSVKKWRHFEQQLQPVVRRLAEAGLVDLAGNALPKLASS